MAEGGHHGGHFKLILALVLIVGILGLVAYANTGQKFLNALKIGKVTNVQPSTPTETFDILFKTGNTALYGRSFSIANSPFTFEGICSLIRLGGLTVKSSETRCSVSSDSFTGTFQYSTYGSIVFSGRGNGVTLNSEEFSADTPINFDMEVIPTGFFVGGVNENKISLTIPYGTVEKYKNGSLIASASFLNQTTIDINTLTGSIQLTNGELKITGTATSVVSEEFSK